MSSTPRPASASARCDGGNTMVTASTTAPVATETAAPVRRKRHRFGRRTREAMLGYALILPSLIIFGMFVFYPFFKNFQLSLYRTPPFPNLPKRYVGFEQFRQILGSADFRNSLKVTVLFAVLTVPIGIILGLLLAVVAHQKLRGITAY